MCKRFFDLVLSATLLFLVAPLLIPVAVLLRLTGEGNVFYIQQRIGKDGKTFGLVKFATMLKDSPNLPGGDITSANDPRVLPAGRLLRKTKINELPQLLNILLGSMSVVGPRPLTRRTFSYYPPHIQQEILVLKPGLTGIGSIVFRDEEAILKSSSKSELECYVEDVAPYKGKLEIWYKERCSLGLDVMLIFLTAWAVVFPRTNLHFRILRSLPRSPLVNP